MKWAAFRLDVGCLSRAVKQRTGKFFLYLGCNDRSRVPTSVVRASIGESLNVSRMMLDRFSGLRRGIRSECPRFVHSSLLSAALSQYARFITIENNETPNPHCMRLFSMEASFLKSGATLDIPSKDHAFKSFLAQKMFEAIPQLISVFLADEYITIRKAEEAVWNDVLPRAHDVVASHLESREPILTPEGEEALVQYYDDTNPEEGDDEVVLAVKELLATRIRPMLLADGGNVRYIDMDDGTVFLLLEGACQTCPSSHITLKSGIERMLMHWIPEVVEAVEVSQEVALELLQAKRSREKK